MKHKSLASIMVAGSIALLASIAQAQGGPPFEEPQVHLFPNDEWNFSQVLGPPNAITVEDGATTTALVLNATNSFGFLQTDDPGKGVLPITGNILAATWRVGTTADDRENVPDFRFRFTAKDGSFTQSYLLQDAFKDDGHDSLVLPNEDGTITFRTLTYVPPSVRNANPDPSSDGFVLAVDMFDFKENPARIGEAVVLHEVVVQEWKPNAFGGTPIFILNQDLRENREHWHPSGDSPGGLVIEHISDDRGLGVRTFGPGEGDPIGTPEDYEFHFGWWERRAAFTVGQNKIYRVKWNVQVVGPDGDASESDAVVSRLRFQDSNLDFVAMAVAGARQDGDTSGNPSPEGREMFAWIAFPDELVGEPIDIFFDVWQDQHDLPEGSTIMLNHVQIREEPAPDRD